MLFKSHAFFNIFQSLTTVFCSWKVSGHVFQSLSLQSCALLCCFHRSQSAPGNTLWIFTEFFLCIFLFSSVGSSNALLSWFFVTHSSSLCCTICHRYFQEKRNPTDFALWKSSKSGEPFWDSPWGKGDSSKFVCAMKLCTFSESFQSNSLCLPSTLMDLLQDHSCFEYIVELLMIECPCIQ